jgi:DNA-binding beta-propeller fold protein YncE
MGSVATRRLGKQVPLLIVAALALALVSLSHPARARAVGELTFDECFGASAPCINVPNNQLSEPYGVALNGANGAVYVTSQGNSSVLHFFSDAEGKLGYDGCLSNDGAGGFCANANSGAKPFSEARGVAVDALRQAVFSSSLSSNLVAQLGAFPQGQIEYKGCISDSGSGGACGSTKSGGSPLDGPGPLAVSPNGATLYVGEAGHSAGQGSISQYFVAPGGGLTYGGCVSNNGSAGWCEDIPGNDNSVLDNVSEVVVNPVTAAVYTSSEINGSVSRFATDPGGQIHWRSCIGEQSTTGTCAGTPGGLESPLETAEGIAISPDGRSLYVASLGGAVSHLVIEPDGSINWQGCISDDGSRGCSDLPGTGTPLKEARGVAVSPDGENVYVTGKTAISSFTLDGAGRLSFQGCLSSDAMPGCTDMPGSPLSGGERVAVSADGGSLYVTGFSSNTLLHLMRAQPAPAPPPPAPPVTKAAPGTTTTTNTTTANATAIADSITAAALKANLLAQLAPSGKSAKLSKVKKSKGYAQSFKALVAGSLQLNWFFLPPGAHVSGAGKHKPKAKPVLFASGQTVFPSAVAKTVSIKLTAKALKLLEHSGTIKLTARGTFTPKGGTAVSATKAFQLKG